MLAMLAEEGVTTLPVPVDAPVIIWVGMAVSVLVAIASAAPKIVGPLATVWEDRVLAARRAAAAKDDADIAGMRREITYLSDAVDALRAEVVRRDRFLAAHAEWDARAQTALARAGIILPPPPSLWPVDDDNH